MVERVEREFGPLDVLVNSAGAAKRTDAGGAANAALMLATAGHLTGANISTDGAASHVIV